MENFEKSAAISEYIERLYPNVSRNMKEELAKEMMTLTDTGLHNLKYSMDQDDGVEPEEQNTNSY